MKKFPHINGDALCAGTLQFLDQEENMRKVNHIFDFLGSHTPLDGSEPRQSLNRVHLMEAGVSMNQNGKGMT
jgi:hypothetical protein